MHQSKLSGHQAPRLSVIVHNTVSQRGTQQQSNNRGTGPPARSEKVAWTEPNVTALHLGVQLMQLLRK